MHYTSVEWSYSGHVDERSFLLPTINLVLDVRPIESSVEVVVCHQHVIESVFLVDLATLICLADDVRHTRICRLGVDFVGRDLVYYCERLIWKSNNKQPFGLRAFFFEKKYFLING